MIAGSYKSDKPIIITGVDKNHLKCDCINESILDGIRHPILYSFALSPVPGYKIYKELRIITFSKKTNKSVLSHKTFCLEDYDHKPVDVKIETINFTCRLFNL